MVAGVRGGCRQGRQFAERQDGGKTFTLMVDVVGAAPLIILGAATAGASPVIIPDPNPGPPSIWIIETHPGESWTCDVVGVGYLHDTFTGPDVRFGNGTFLTPGPVIGLCYGPSGFVAVPGEAD